jgi:Big-like domain-containing protein
LVAVKTSVTSVDGTPTGTVHLKDNGTTIATQTLSSGTATFTHTFLVVGSHPLTVQYVSDGNFAGGTSAVTTQTVNKAPTATGLTSSTAGSSVFGQPVTFTATVKSAFGSPTGSVTFKDGTTTLGSVTLSGGVAALTTSTLGVASHSITANYNGDTNFATSSLGLTQTVSKATTTTTVGSSGTPSVYGNNVTFTATVSENSPSTAVPTCTGSCITFTDGGFFIGSGALTNGTATFTTNTLTAGSHSIEAFYPGTADFVASNNSSALLTQIVDKASSSTSVALTAGTNPSTFGSSVTFTATVTVPGGLAPATGTVAFFDGATQIGTGAIGASSPPYTVSFSTSALAAGSHSITAHYGGDSNYNPSVSPVLTQQVNAAATTTVVASNNNPSVFGQSVKFTATVTSAGGVPPGTATFKDGTTTLISGVALSGGIATYTTSTLTAGTHSITVVYSPTGGNFSASTSAAITQTVNREATTVTLTSSRNPAYFRQSITFTATVHASVGAPSSGTFTFKDGGSTLCNAVPISGTGATCAVAAELGVGKLGAHSITASFNGSANFAPSTSPALRQQRSPAPRRVP